MRDHVVVVVVIVTKSFEERSGINTHCLLCRLHFRYRFSLYISLYILNKCFSILFAKKSKIYVLCTNCRVSFDFAFQISYSHLVVALNLKKQILIWLTPTLPC